MTRYANGSYQRASGTRTAFAGLSADLVAEGYPEIVVNSGDREPDVQEAIFRDKFVPSSGPKDVGPYNDRRFWPGHGWWKRVKGGGTVGVPMTSNHEKRRAADLAYPYNSDTPAHRRAQLLAKRHNITCEGMGFKEWWHWTHWGPLGTIDQPGTAGGSTTSEEDDMFTDQDRDNITSILTALGAGDLKPGGWSDTIMGNTRDIKAQVNGLPDALKGIKDQVNGIPEVLADIRARVGVSDAQVKVIADAVVKQIGKPTVMLDYAAIAKAVNDDAARRLAG